MRILGIETSCDDTSIACLDSERGLLACQLAGQADLHGRYGGVVPEIASRAHLQAIDPLLHLTLEEAGWALGDVELIAVTQGPGLLGSLLVGMTTAKALSLRTGAPLVGVNHLLAHAAAPQLPDLAPLPAPCLTLIVSGGHTELVLSAEPDHYLLIGSTVDDAAGEVLDKLGRELGLGFPAGAAIDQLAADGDPSRYALPRPLLHSGDYQFSFAGLKTAALKAFGLLGGPRQKGDQRLMPDPAAPPFGPADLADACASIQAAVMEVLAVKTLRAAEEHGVAAIALGGGVAANSELRRRLAEGAERLGCSFHAPPIAWCMDNAAMIALAGWQRYQQHGADGLDLDPFATWAWPAD